MVGREGSFQAVWQDMDPQKALAWLLGRLMDRLPGTLGVAVADAHGLAMAGGLSGRDEAAAVAALITRSSREFFQDLGLQGEPWWVIIEGEAATIVTSPVSGGNETLILILQPRSELERAKVEMQRAAILIREVLDRM